MSNPGSIAAALADVLPSEAHISYSQARGVNPVTFLAVVRTRLDELVYSLRKIAETIPADDQNAAKVADVIARLA